MDKPNHHKPLEEKKVSFGKYAGYKYSEVPTEYLEWFVSNSYKQMINRCKWAEEELQRRKSLSI